MLNLPSELKECVQTTDDSIRNLWHNAEVEHELCSVRSIIACGCVQLIVLKVLQKTRWAATWQNHRNDLCAQQRLRSACIRPDWSESLLCAQWVAKDQSFLHADIKDCPVWSESSLGAHVILLVLSCGGSIFLFQWWLVWRVVCEK